MASGAFGGTTLKCKACEKTVYLVDQLTADGRVYHKACFRCHHCKGTLKVIDFPPLPFCYLYCLLGSFCLCSDLLPPCHLASGVDVLLSVSGQNLSMHNYNILFVDVFMGALFNLLSNYSSIDGVLYCRPHYDQLFKMTGSLDKSFEGSSRSAKADRSNGHESTANRRFSSMFVGTQDKCVVCKKTVYPIEKVAVDGTPYHRPCFKCSHGGCVISPSNHVAHEGRIYCKHHHSQLVMAKGNFSQLEDKHGGIKVPTENPAPDDNAEKLEDRHEGIKVPTENPAPDDDAESAS
ncbi:hypothetical protein COCNU_11G008760 [Cocos nucifera]|uniref:LIM zinc-binding domain-containing protein n=1 Tax=Cocos nucifera TaxID=13894 RepID=A0A8K0IR62_COCNU|nr:hypothetical protein COCNU_11G008760 [Cocos nucifera]